MALLIKTNSDLATMRVEVKERMTAAQFLIEAPEDRKAELIDGVMVIPMPPFDNHEKLQIFLLRLTSAFAEELDRGEVRGSRTPVVLEEFYAPEPDVLFVHKERADIVQQKGVFGAPDLVIEILSAGTARDDRGKKFRAYERAGVRELWLIDPYGPAGTDFYQLEEGTFCPVHPDGDNILESVAVPGFWIDVAWLWPEDGKFIPVRQALAQILGE